MLKARNTSRICDQCASTLAILRIQDSECGIRCGRDQVAIAKIHKRGMAFRVEEQSSCFRGPIIDEIVYGSATASVSFEIKDNAVHFLLMSLEAVQRFGCRYIPNSDSAVIASTYQRVRMRCNGSHGVTMALEVTNVKPEYYPH
jgi:hypothetical protein